MDTDINGGGNCQRAPCVGIAARSNVIITNRGDRERSKRYSVGGVVKRLEEKVPLPN